MVVIFSPFWLGIGSPHQAIHFEATNYITKIKTALGNLSMLRGAVKVKTARTGIQRSSFFFEVVDCILLRFGCGEVGVCDDVGSRTKNICLHLVDASDVTS